jgi:chromosome segregation ATPase
LQERLDAATERVAQVSAVAEELKRARREEAQQYKATLAELTAEHERRLSRAREAASATANRIAALEQQLRTRDSELEAAAREALVLDKRVAAALHDLDVAHQQLMVVDVKLNILEGAANMLDRRLRAAQGPVTDVRA